MGQATAGTRPVWFQIIRFSQVCTSIKKLDYKKRIKQIKSSSFILMIKNPALFYPPWFFCLFFSLITVRINFSYLNFLYCRLFWYLSFRCSFRVHVYIYMYKFPIFCSNNNNFVVDLIEQKVSRKYINYFFIQW